MRLAILVQHSAAMATGAVLLISLSASPVASAAVKQTSEQITTTLPARVEVGRSGAVSVHYSVKTAMPTSTVAVELVKGTAVVAKQVLQRSPRQSFVGTIELSESALGGSGHFDWTVTASFPMHNGEVQVPVTIRQHSLLGEAVHRSGQLLTVRGAARKLNSASSAWVDWTGQLIHVQRWSADGWVTIRTATANAAGIINVQLRIPFRVGIRLTDNSTSNIWGEATVSTVS